MRYTPGPRTNGRSPWLKAALLCQRRNLQVLPGFYESYHYILLTFQLSIVFWVQIPINAKHNQKKKLTTKSGKARQRYHNYCTAIAVVHVKWEKGIKVFYSLFLRNSIALILSSIEKAFISNFLNNFPSRSMILCIQFLCVTANVYFLSTIKLSSYTFSSE